MESKRNYRLRGTVFRYHRGVSDTGQYKRPNKEVRPTLCFRRRCGIGRKKGDGKTGINKIGRTNKDSQAESGSKHKYAKREN